MWLGTEHPVALPWPADGINAAEQLAILIDVQPESAGRPMDALHASDDQGHVVVRLNDGGRGMVTVDFGNPSARFVAQASTSLSVAKRLLISTRPANGQIDVYELQQWADNSASPAPAPIEILIDERPSVVGPSSAGVVRIGDSPLPTPYVGRTANVALFGHMLGADRAEALRTASDNPFALTFDELGRISAEMRELALDDIARLRELMQSPTFTPRDMRDAAGVLSRWLLDAGGGTPPMLDLLARRLGLQVWFPGQSEHERRYNQVIASAGPVFSMRGDHGLVGPFDCGVWVDAASWLDEVAFTVRGLATSNGQLIKMVRNKLGGGHFDESDRRSWQRELLDLTKSLTLMNTGALEYQVRALVRVACDALTIAMLEQAIRSA